ncbi:SH2 domain-containing protein [Cunninghamella echinulata]|nr:SH2 domain-containing protein [Cunninghamella echinulata]
MRLLLLYLLAFLLITCTSAFPQLSNTQVLLVTTAAILTLPSLVYVYKEYHAKETYTHPQQQKQVQLNVAINLFTDLPFCTDIDLPHDILPILTYADLPTCTYADAPYGILSSFYYSDVPTDYLQTIISEMNQICESGTSATNLEMVNNEATKSHNNSSRTQFKSHDQPEDICHCISLARRSQNSILGYSNSDLDDRLLANSSNPLHAMITNNDLALFYWEGALISVFNDMCVDINSGVIQSSNAASSLQTVYDDFGPRKTQDVFNNIEFIDEHNASFSLALRQITTTNHFINCTNYPCTKYMNREHKLNDTSFCSQGDELVDKIPGVALEMGEGEMDDYNYNIAIISYTFMEDQEKLYDLILGDYAGASRQQCNLLQQKVVDHIKLELKGFYRNQESKYTKFNTEEMFTLVTGKTKESLGEGFVVHAKAISADSRVANFVFDSGFEGSIYVVNVSTDRLKNGGDVLAVGQVLNCKIACVDCDIFLVELSCKAPDTKSNSPNEMKQELLLNEYSDGARAEKEKLDKVEKQQQKKFDQTNPVMNRPLIQNLSCIEAEKYLENRKPGDFVIRSFSRGDNDKHMAITWKVSNNVYQHANIKEKVPKDSGVATMYTIGDLEFEDLDGRIVAYIEAIIQNVNDLIAYPKFQYGGNSTLYNYLNSATRTNPKIPAYGFCLNENAGYFDLSFKFNQESQISHSVVKVLPDKYLLRNNSYSNANDLINAFKCLQASEVLQNKKSQQKQQQHSSFYQSQSQDDDLCPYHYLYFIMFSYMVIMVGTFVITTCILVVSLRKLRKFLNKWIPSRLSPTFISWRKMFRLVYIILHLLAIVKIVHILYLTDFLLSFIRILLFTINLILSLWLLKHY